MIILIKYLFKRKARNKKIIKVKVKKIKEMGAVLSDFLTVTNILEITKTVKFQVKDFINGLMVILTTVSGLMGRNTVMEFGKEIYFWVKETVI